MHRTETARQVLVYLLPLKVSEINTFLLEDLAVVWMFSDLLHLLDAELCSNSHPPIKEIFNKPSRNSLCSAPTYIS